MKIKETKLGYPVYEFEKNGEGTVTLYGSISKNYSPYLSEEQAEKLINGESIEMELQYNGVEGFSSSYPCTIVPMKINNIENRVGEDVFENKVLQLGIAWHMLKKADQSLYGYKVWDSKLDDGNGAAVQFFKEAFVDDEKVGLSPKDCLDLVWNGKTNIEDQILFYDGVITKSSNGEELAIPKARVLSEGKYLAKKEKEKELELDESILMKGNPLGNDGCRIAI